MSFLPPFQVPYFTLLFCWSFLVTWSFTLTSPAKELQHFSFTEPHMGTLFRVDLYAEQEELAKKAVDLAFQEIETINLCASDYLPDSELTRFNLAPPHQPFQASPVFFDLVKRSVKLHEQTKGAFDITTDYSIQAWRRAKRQARLPESEEIKRALSMTQIEALEFNEAQGFITKKIKNLRINLGGIGKGYAADKALAVLKSQGFPIAMVAGSGDIALGAAPPQTKGWKVTLKRGNPLDEDLVLELSHAGISTSGDTQQFFMLDGKTYSHVIDPKTGLGLSNRLICTVIAPNATLSDSFDNAMCVLGVTEGLQVLAQHGLRGRFVQLKENQKSSITLTPNFDSKP